MRLTQPEAYCVKVTKISDSSFLEQRKVLPFFVFKQLVERNDLLQVFDDAADWYLNSISKVNDDQMRNYCVHKLEKCFIQAETGQM